MNIFERQNHRFFSIQQRVRMVLFIGVLFTGLSGSAQTWPSGAHDPSSMIKDGNTYWVFATGDGIYSKYSTDMVTWSDGKTPFAKGTFPDWILKYAKTSTDAFDGFFWAPDIIYMNNQYYLYYSCSVWGTMSSCIGVVVNKTLNPNSANYKWVDQGDIGIYSSGGDVNAIDPSLMRGPDGKIWMVYGSFNKGGIMVTEIDSVSGKPKGGRTSIANSYTGSWYGEGEGACMFYRNEYYYLVYNKGGCCNGVASTYYMVIGRSKNPTGPFVDKDGKNMKVIGAPSGGTVFFRHNDARAFQDRYFGPGHFGIYRENGVDYVSFHYYDPNGYYPSAAANYKGGPTLGLGMLEWGDDGWPVLSFDFIDDGIYSLINSNSNKALDLQNHSAANDTYLWQYSRNSSRSTQKWVFKSLGTGEYTIQNYADNDLYVEAAGNDNNELLQVTSDYKRQINQKFRVVKGVNDRFLIYPSTSNSVFEIPYAYTSDYQVKLWVNTNHACQRWTAQPFTENLSLSQNELMVNASDTTVTDISVLGNAVWKAEVENGSWLVATPFEGDGETMLSLHISSNTSELERTNKLFIRSNGGEVDTVFITQAANKETGVSFNRTADQIKLYPNPTTGRIVVKGLEGKTTVRIFSSLGKSIRTVELDDVNSGIDISQLKPGLYLVEISVENGRVHRMLMKE